MKHASLPGSAIAAHGFYSTAAEAVEAAEAAEAAERRPALELYWVYDECTAR